MTSKEKIKQSIKTDIKVQDEKRRLVEKLAERIKNEFYIQFDEERIKNEFYIQFDEILPSIMSDRIDEIVKEVLDEEFFEQ